MRNRCLPLVENQQTKHEYNAEAGYRTLGTLVGGGVWTKRGVRPWPTLWSTLWPTLWPTGGQILKKRMQSIAANLSTLGLSHQRISSAVLAATV